MIIDDQFLSQMRKFINEKRLLKRGDTVLIGFSGGPDSTALLHSLMSIHREYDLTLIAAHVNYHLRGEESEADVKFVKEFCFEHCISLVIKDSPISKAADIENEARRIRLDYFNSLVKIYRIDKIALGHNREDLVETMLLHLFRGAGITGLRGILPISNNIIRPLLGFTRDEILQYLQSVKIDNWREDSSNREDLYTRNRVRNFLLPWLEDNVNNRVIDLLYENSLIYKETDEYLREIAARMIKKSLINQNQKEIALDLKVIGSQKDILLFYIFRQVISILTGSETGFYQSHFREILAIISSEGSKMIKLPGDITVLKEYKKLLFTIDYKVESAILTEDKKQQVIDISKKYRVFGNKRIMVRRINRHDLTRTFFEDRNIALLDLEKISQPITVGYREEGERFQPMGMSGSKKLKDFFIDEKVSKFERDRVLIFRDSEKILWIAGLRIDERVRINEQTQSILLLKIENIRIRSRRSVTRIKQQ